MAEKEKLISEFNEAKLQIFRLHNIWLECKHFRETGRLVHWKWKLDTATIELWNDAKRLDNESEEEGNYISSLKKLDKEIFEAEKQKNLAKLYQKLVEKEKLLREIQEEAGKGARYKPVDEDYI